MIAIHPLKKAFSVSILLLVSVAYSTAQSSVKCKFGLTGGVNAAQLQQIVRSHILWRYNTGVTVEQNISPGISVAYQLLYSQQGSSTPTSGIQGNDRIINTFNYISLPVTVRVSPKTNSLFFAVGVQGGYLLDGKGYFSSSINQATVFRNTHKIDAGPTGGIGYRLSNHWVMETRYYHGLRPILSDFTAADPQTGISTLYRSPKWYNRVWSLNLSYYF